MLIYAKRATAKTPKRRSRAGKTARPLPTMIKLTQDVIRMHALVGTVLREFFEHANLRPARKGYFRGMPHNDQLL